MKLIRQKTGAIRVMADGVDPMLQEGETELQAIPNDLDGRMAAKGIQWGNVVAWASKQLGIKQCAPCKARQFLLNHIAENGVVNTMRAIKDTIR